MKFSEDFKHPYEFDPKYEKPTAYFSMEFAIDQPLKTYSGGLGFLSGSHMRSAYELHQNMVGIGILWKYGYYDQVRKGDKTMDVLFQEKIYSFLEDPGIEYEITVHGHTIKVKAFYLPPGTFGTVPMFFLSTDIPENDYLSQSISHRLYDANNITRVAQSILLGVGGAKLLDILERETEVYHINEAHALPVAFYLYNKYQDLKEVRKRFVFTTHTPEEAGNEIHDVSLLVKMSYFCETPLEEVRKIAGIEGESFNTSLVALRMARMANAVSKKHGEISNEMWSGYDDICPIIAITNAQNKKYWADRKLYDAVERNDGKYILKRKRDMKKKFFELVADQTGKILDPKILTIVWARRFAGYKRADLITSDEERFERIMSNKEYPIQIVWAGKPYPMDYFGIGQFDTLVHLNKNYMNSAIMVGYELHLSRMAKIGSDVWLNTPRVPREASGTSGMTAAMNGSVNFSTNDGWILEYAKHGVNSFVVPHENGSLPVNKQDQLDATHLYDILEKEIIPMYYNNPEKWAEVVMNSMRDVIPYFDSDRMADEYYRQLYQNVPELVKAL